MMEISDEQAAGVEKAYNEYLLFQEAKMKMHAISKSFKRMVEHTDTRNANYYLDEGTAYVKRIYHSGGEDDILRRDVE